MTLNIRKVPAQRAENYKNHKKTILYYFNRNCLYLYPGTLCSGLFLRLVKYL